MRVAFGRVATIAVSFDRYFYINSREGIQFKPGRDKPLQ